MARVNPHANWKENYGRKNATCQIGFRVSLEEAARVKNKADSLGITMTDYIKKLLQEDYDKCQITSPNTI